MCTVVVLLPVNAFHIIKTERKKKHAQKRLVKTFSFFPCFMHKNGNIKEIGIQYTHRVEHVEKNSNGVFETFDFLEMTENKILFFFQFYEKKYGGTVSLLEEF